MGEEKIRAFIAFEPSAQIRRALGNIQNKLRGSDLGSQIRWVKPEGIHLTLKFLGDINLSQLEEVGSVMERVAGKQGRFKIACGGIGLFPEAGNPRVIWVGLTRGVSDLARLSHDLDLGLSQLGFEPEQRGFKAHLTLGRVKSRLERGRLASLVDGLKTPPMEMEAGEVILFRSDLRAQGAIYTPLNRVDLAHPRQ